MATQVTRILTDGLALAAAPTFMSMALVSCLNEGRADMVCAALPGSMSSGPISFGAMSVMYLLMSVFHLVPWLRLWSRRRWNPDLR